MLKKILIGSLGLLLLSCSQSTVKPTGIYQGILLTASGPGREVLLYLFPNQDFVMKTIYLKEPKNTFWDFGKWEIKEDFLKIKFDKEAPLFFTIKGKNLFQKTNVNNENHDLPYFQLLKIGEF